MEKQQAEQVFTDSQKHFNTLRQYGYHPRMEHNGDMMTLIIHHESVDPDQTYANIDPDTHPDKYHRIDNINPMVIQHWLESRMQRLADIGFNPVLDKHPKKQNIAKVYPKGHHDLNT